MHSSEVFDWIEDGNDLDRRQRIDSLRLSLGIDAGEAMNHSERLDTVLGGIGVGLLKHYAQLRHCSAYSPELDQKSELIFNGLNKLGLLAVVSPGAGSENDSYITQQNYAIIGEWLLDRNRDLTKHILTQLWNTLQRQHRLFAQKRYALAINPSLIGVEQYLKNHEWEGLFNKEGMLSLTKLPLVVSSPKTARIYMLGKKSLKAGEVLVDWLSDKN